MIFVTVGTQFPFDRLVRAVDEVAGNPDIETEWFAQVGHGGYRPANMEWAETLDRESYAHYIERSKALIGHAGVGTILTALEAGKPLLVMPRLERFGEVVSDHQVATARKFAELGAVLVAADETEVAERIVELRSFRAAAGRDECRRVIDRVSAFVEEIAGGAAS